MQSIETKLVLHCAKELILTCHAKFAIYHIFISYI